MHLLLCAWCMKPRGKYKRSPAWRSHSSIASPTPYTHSLRPHTLDIEREFIDLPKTHNDWEFLKLGKRDDKGQPTPPLNADFALRAYGGNIGEIKTEGLNELRPKINKENAQVSKLHIRQSFYFS